MMKVLTLITIVTIGLPALVAADLSDNQITDDIRPMMPFRYSRPSRARSYAVKSCSPCGPNECQVMGMQRFSEPRCEAFGGLGSPCRMWQEPDNKTLHFPDKILNCDNVYMQFCPCTRGLVCEEAECKRPRRPYNQVRPADANGHRTRQQGSQLELEAEMDGFEVPEERDEREDEMPISFEPGKSKFPWAVARFH